jgi:hypothetical protein
MYRRYWLRLDLHAWPWPIDLLAAGGGVQEEPTVELTARIRSLVAAAASQWFTRQRRNRRRSCMPLPLLAAG